MNKEIYALVDCDSFFASCEQADNPELKGKPVCVLSNNMGCVIARSPEAKKYGIKMCMPYFSAKEQYPQITFLRGNLKKYKQYSIKIMNILKDYSPEVEIYSIDEAFIRLTGLRKLYKKNYYKIAKEIREKILNEVGISVSIGISMNKTLAKLASHQAKELDLPEEKKVFLMGKHKINSILKKTNIEEIWGVGRNSNKKLNQHGVYTAYDLTLISDERIKKLMGKNGFDTKMELLGHTMNKINPKSSPPKSIQYTRSFLKPSSNKIFIKEELQKHIIDACQKLYKTGGKCSVVAVMLKTKDFIVYSDKIALDTPTDSEMEISKQAYRLLEKIFIPTFIYRTTGISLSNITYEEIHQLELFNFNKEAEKNEKLSKSLNKLKSKFGKNIIKTGLNK